MYHPTCGHHDTPSASLTDAQAERYQGEECARCCDAAYWGGRDAARRESTDTDDETEPAAPGGQSR